jgi:Flp pilus assembly protein TadD
MSGHDETARLERLLEFHQQDPDNLQLILDCAEAALAAARPELAFDFLTNLPEGTELDAPATNLAGIAAMRSGNQAAAQERFRLLLKTNSGDPSLHFNLAWSLALSGDKEGAIDALDDEAIEALPQAAMLDLQLRHEAGEWDTVGDRMHRYLARHPDYAPLQAAASVLAMDLDDPELARSCALKAGNHPDAEATLGLLELGDNRPAEAAARFASALEIRPHNPRARVGLGLTRLAQGQNREAADDLDAGARVFGDHLGSWIAAGWAHVLAGNLVVARERFETALGIDDTFAEVHGSLAALDAIDGNAKAARTRLEIALRLDRKCFSAALAAVLLARDDGDGARARAILETALRQPITPDGKTLGAALAGMTR